MVQGVPSPRNQGEGHGSGEEPRGAAVRGTPRRMGRGTFKWWRRELVRPSSARRRLTPKFLTKELRLLEAQLVDVEAQRLSLVFKPVGGVEPHGRGAIQGDCF